MSRILIAYTTGEGQTAKITATLADHLINLGHEVVHADLAEATAWPDPATFDGAIVAASVHGGKHQRTALRYVKRYAAALSDRPSAFLSVSLSAAATTETGRLQAEEQAQAFLLETDWRPDLLKTLAGALRSSQMPFYMRSITAFAQRLFRTDLSRLGWPEDLTEDREFTDWEAVRRVAEDFAAQL